MPGSGLVIIQVMCVRLQRLASMCARRAKVCTRKSSSFFIIRMNCRHQNSGVYSSFFSRKQASEGLKSLRKGDVPMNLYLTPIKHTHHTPLWVLLVGLASDGVVARFGTLTVFK